MQLRKFTAIFQEYLDIYYLRQYYCPIKFSCAEAREFGESPKRPRHCNHDEIKRHWAKAREGMRVGRLGARRPICIAEKYICAGGFCFLAFCLIDYSGL